MRNALKCVIIFAGILVGCSSLAWADVEKLTVFTNNVRPIRVDIYNDSHYRMSDPTSRVENGKFKYDFDEIDASSRGFATAESNPYAKWMVVHAEYVIQYQGESVGKCIIFAENHIQNPVKYDIRCTTSSPHSIYTQKSTRTTPTGDIFIFTINHRPSAAILK